MNTCHSGRRGADMSRWSVYTLEDYYNYYLDFFYGSRSTGAVGKSPPSQDAASDVSVRHCGDLGSGYRYAIYMNNNYYQPASRDGNYINPIGALSGSSTGALYLDGSPRRQQSVHAHSTG
jgi:hypothetical protein